MLAMPKILKLHFSVNDELNYEWDKEKCGIYYHEYINEKLSRVLWSLNHKATVGLATALSEWILWRLTLSNQNEFTQDFNSLEAIWAGLVDKKYIIDLLSKRKKEGDKVMGPLWVTFKCMDDVRYNYIEGKMFINEKVSTLAAIARLVTPDSGFFDSWLSNTINKAVALFPAEYDRGECNDLRERYDSSHELPISREFYFDPAFDYSTENVDTLLTDFLSSLDYKKNEFLNSPELMIENGYIGIPYEYKKK